MTEEAPRPARTPHQAIKPPRAAPHIKKDLPKVYKRGNVANHTLRPVAPPKNPTE